MSTKEIKISGTETSLFNKTGWGGGKWTIELNKEIYFKHIEANIYGLTQLLKEGPHSAEDGPCLFSHC